MATKPSPGSFAKVSFLNSSFQPNPLQVQVDKLREELDQTRREFQQALEVKEQRTRELEEQKQQI